jgi:NAD(P)-dependent dehydrogenase (short-subunit alcohol dehydrogenase family)
VGFGAPGAGREESADGHELRLAVNYLAPVALTRALLPLLRASAPSRIVNVGSAGQLPLDFDDFETTRNYDGVTAYRRSKLALAAHTFALAEELAGTGVSVNVLHPATFIDTAMVREASIEPLSTISDGAAGVLALATTEAGQDNTGRYFDGTSPSRARAEAYDRDVWKRLEAATDRLLGA